ncbi:MAG: thioredoxin [Candidatus Woykebacteria bacterium RBG_13_40_7b]|uniref:Thioredoxin n=1 Tax=Candidatus Woykebacteria bacterium RBG_13_40_7b TaxID=1802594 RepID=A0A1G1WBN0_9BACT|nr:MAG: thioredoxin [Candidatus Woykebacteria bacterium RBG_13_40_7b]
MTVELLDFWAEWCGPCRVMASVIDEVEKEFKDKITLQKINVDEDEKTATKYNVLSIPTYIILKNGKEVERVVGAVSKETIEEKINKNLA